VGVLGLSVGCSDSGGGDAGASGTGAGASAAPGSGGSGAASGPGSGASSGAGASATGSGASGGAGPGAGGGGPLPVDECAGDHPDWVFCSGFEEGNKDIWDDHDGNPDETNLLVDDPGPFGNAGNHAMRIRVPEGNAGADLVKELPASDALWARWYIQYEPGFDFDAPNHGGGLHAGSRDWLGHSHFQPAGDEWFTGWVEYDSNLHAPYVYSYYPGMYMDCADPDGACWGDHFPCMMDDGSNYCTKPEHQEKSPPIQLQTGKWYCVELFLDGGAPTPSAEGASGRLDVRIDGESLGPWDDLWMRSTADVQVGILWLSLYHHAEHSVPGVLYDHVVVSRSPIGCNAGGAP
jgi:hypothetical protein